jgi:hypothetical protein
MTYGGIVIPNIIIALAAALSTTAASPHAFVALFHQPTRGERRTR